MMNRLLLVLVVCVLVVSCSKHEGASLQDSILTAPTHPAPAGPPHVDSASNLWIDSSVVRQQPDMQVLKRFTPQQVVDLYTAYRPLRNSSTTPAQIDSFRLAHKISVAELRSILSEGDRLGWAGRR